MNKKENRQEVDVSFLARILKANIILILIVAMVCGAGLGAYRFFRTVPTYTSGVSFFVNGVNTMQSGESYIAPGAANAERAAEEGANLVKNWPVAKLALEIVEASDKFDGMTPEKAISYISASADGQILTVKVTHPDPEVAYQLAVAMGKVVPRFLDSTFTGQQLGDEETLGIVKMVVPAVKDTTPSGKNTVTFALIGFLIGALAVYLVAFLKAFFDRTIYTEEEIIVNFDLPIVGQIPSWSTDGNVATKKKKKKVGEEISRDYTGRMLTAKTPFAVSEAFKLLRTNMCYTANNSGSCAVYGIVSPNAGEGKSIVAANTAISFAQMGKRVLLIDGDLRAPVQRKIFALEPKADGLSDLLAGMKEFKDVLRTIEGVDNLNVIQSGRIPPNPAELLASSRMTEVLKEARNSFDVIIIDLPPVCEVADAGVISGVIDHYLMVVRSTQSNIGLASAAVNMLQGFGGSIAGFVINDINLKVGAYYAKSKYGKAYRYGYAYGATKSIGDKSKS